MVNCRIKNGAQWYVCAGPYVCQLSCLAQHQEAGGKQHLSDAKIDWNFKMLCLASALCLFSATTHHLNFMGQILGWDWFASFSEKERAKWIIFTFTVWYFMDQFISNSNIVCHLPQDCFSAQSEMTCNIHYHYCQGLLEPAIVDRTSLKKP